MAWRGVVCQVHQVKGKALSTLGTAQALPTSAMRKHSQEGGERSGSSVLAFGEGGEGRVLREGRGLV